MNKKFLLIPALALGACVPLPEEYVNQVKEENAAAHAPVEGLDSPYLTKETLHFKVSSYSDPEKYSEICENNYTRIMQDLGLYSFVPQNPYDVTVYKNSEEYHKKTHQPDWSGGAAYINSLLLYESPSLETTIAHEMTHLIFNEFMGLSMPDNIRWLNEGAAVYEQTRADTRSEAYYSSSLETAIKPNPIPFSQMINLAPRTESQKNVDRWYTQVWSVTYFIIQRGGAFNFSVFLGKLKEGDSLDAALAEVYPGKWNSASELENSWKKYINE